MTELEERAGTNEELLALEEANIWFEYLEETRGLDPARYARVEPWAWARLEQRYRAHYARRRAAA